MPTIERINKPVVQRLGNDSIYGEGIDGDVTITSNTTLGRDMYYRSLTVNSDATLVTNGYRIFVEKTLTNNGTIGLPSGLGEATGSGTVIGRVADAPGSKQYVLGESASGTQVPEAILKDLKQVIQGWHFDPVDGIRKIEGGDDGTAGSDVGGSAGGAGGAGTHPGAGPGQLGAPGTSGNAGGTGGGGAKGIGGGLVVIVANTVLGTGYIVSQGDAGDAGSTGAAGTSGISGNTQNANPVIIGHNPPGHNPGNTATAPPGNTSYFAGNPPIDGESGNPGDDAVITNADPASKQNADVSANANPPTYDSDPPEAQPPSYKETYNPPNPPVNLQSNVHYHVGITNSEVQDPHHYTQPGNPGTLSGHQAIHVPPVAHGNPPFVVTTGNAATTADPPVKINSDAHSVFPGNPPNPGNPPHTGQPPSYAPGDAAGFNVTSTPIWGSNTQYTGGAAGGGGTGGTGTSGNAGGEGGLLIVTEASLPPGMATGDFSTVLLNE